MVAIASYYAQVGMQIDKSSLAQVQSYLDNIQKKMERFQKNLSQSKGLTLRINNISVNQTALRASIRNATAGMNVRLNNVSVSGIRISQQAVSRAMSQALNVQGSGRGLRLNNFHISQQELTRSINDALNVSGRTSRVRIGARLSQASLADMRTQIRQSINQLVVSPTINPRINPNVRPTRGGGNSGGGSGNRPDRLTTHNPRSTSPWHNPLMVGGATGAFMRYGMFSLPFVAGAYGLNSLVDSTTRLEGQSIMMRAAIQDRELAAQQEQYVNQLGDRLGIRTSSMTPFFAQMYAGARGTDLEATLPQGFSDFMDYASVMGLNEEQLKGSIRAISQMISKGRIQSEELRQQLAEQGMPEAVSIMSEVAAGGDRAKLDKMMEMGQLDSIKYLPMFFEALGKRAKPFIEDFYNTVEYQRRRAAKKNEDFLKAFMAGGATEGMVAIFDAFSQSVENSIPFADALGDAFRRAGNLVAAMILVPKEFVEWWNGTEHDNNFMKVLFGDSDESELVNTISQIKNLTEALLKSLNETMTGQFHLMSKELSAIASTINFLLTRIMETMQILDGYSTGGIEGGGYALRKIAQKWSISDTVNQEFDDQEAVTGVPVPFSQRNRVIEDRLRAWEQNNPAPKAMDNPITGFSAGNWAADAGRWTREKLGGMFSPQDSPVHFPSVPSDFSNFEEALLNNYGWIGTPPVMPMESDYIGRLENQTLSNAGIGDTLSQLLNQLPGNNPTGGVISERNVNINISGTFSVDGSIETLTPDMDIGEAIRGVLEEEIGSVIPQTGNIPK